MPFSLRHIPHWNALELKGNGKNSPGNYARYMNFVGAIPEAVWMDEYTVLIPEDYLDAFIGQFGEITTMTQTVASIKGVEEPLLPDIPYEAKHFDSLKLPPYPFQKMGINYLVSVKRGIIGDEMGLGNGNCRLHGKPWLR